MEAVTPAIMHAVLAHCFLFFKPYPATIEGTIIRPKINVMKNPMKMKKNSGGGFESKAIAAVRMAIMPPIKRVEIPA